MIFLEVFFVKAAAKQLITVQANGNLYHLSKVISFIVYQVFYFLFICSLLN